MGLGVSEIARIAFITGLTYWLGNAFVLGCGIALAPGAASAIDHLPAPVNRLIGIAALLAINCYMLWLLPRPRSIGRSPWRIALPNPPSTLVQIAIGSLDLIFVTLAMYALLPAQPAIDFFDLLVIFVTAMLIGVVSYVPGSLGVIEAAMFISLPQFPREDLLASLADVSAVLFRRPAAVGVAAVRPARSPHGSRRDDAKRKSAAARHRPKIRLFGCRLIFWMVFCSSASVRRPSAAAAGSRPSYRLHPLTRRTEGRGGSGRTGGGRGSLISTGRSCGQGSAEWASLRRQPDLST